MTYKDRERKALTARGRKRTYRHGNWRQTYIDCGGMCVAQVNGQPCGRTEQLELHDQWGENHDPEQGKFQKRFLICNRHHAHIDDRVHNTSLIERQYRPSRLQEDVQLEIAIAGDYSKWVEKYHLDDTRFGRLLYAGPEVEEDLWEESSQ